MFNKRNVKSSKLGFLFHSRCIPVSARATTNHGDVMLFSSQRLWAVGLSATAHHVALVWCCTHRSGQHVVATESHRKKLQIARNRRQTNVLLCCGELIQIQLRKLVKFSVYFNDTAIYISVQLCFGAFSRIGLRVTWFTVALTGT